MEGDIWREGLQGQHRSRREAGWLSEAEEVEMLIVGGLDLHRRQVTFDVVDTPGEARPSRLGTLGQAAITVTRFEAHR